MDMIGRAAERAAIQSVMSMLLGKRGDKVSFKGYGVRRRSNERSFGDHGKVVKGFQ
jgi:hypothetical protein